MKLLLFDDWKSSASLQDNITQTQEVKLQYEMYECARGLEALLNNGEKPGFHQYFQKALSLFHRFSHQISFRKFDRYVYMTACLFLSSKDTDVFDWSIDKYVKGFLNYCQKRAISNNNKPQIDQFPIQLPSPILIQEDPLTYEASITKLYTEKILDAESHILQMIGYDLDIIVPQVYFEAAQKQISVQQGDVNKLFEATQKLINDLFFTTICLYYEPKIMALCAIQTGSMLLKMNLSDLANGQPWFSVFSQNVNENQIIYNQIQEVQKYFDECIKSIK